MNNKKSWLECWYEGWYEVWKLYVLVENPLPDRYKLEEWRTNILCGCVVEFIVLVMLAMLCAASRLKVQTKTTFSYKYAR